MPNIKKIIGRGIRSIHLLFGIILSIGSIIVELEYLQILIAFWLLMIASNITCRGCPITKLEYQLTKENKTIVDPFLDLARMKINNNNRYGVTVFMGVTNLLICLCRYSNWG